MSDTPSMADTGSTPSPVEAATKSPAQAAPPRKWWWPARLAALGGGLVLLGAVYAGARPWFHNWGSTAEERTRVLPGDEILPGSQSLGTHAIAIDAPASDLWRWLAQTGQDRGGFHSYELLEDLVGCRMNNLSLLDSRLQQWKIGDKLWMYPPDKLGGAGHAVLLSFEPGRTLGFGTRQVGTSLDQPVNGSWTFVIEPTGASTSRLFVRSRALGQPSWPVRLFNAAVFEPAHFTMERRMMTVLKARAEGRRVSEGRASFEVVLWFATFVLLVRGAVMVIAGRRPGRSLATFVAGGLLLQWLTLGQPSPWLSAPAVLLLALVALVPRLPRPAPTAAAPALSPRRV